MGYRRALIGALLAATGVLLTPPRVTRAQAPAAPDSTLIEIAAARARLVAGQLETANQPARGRSRADPATTQYLAGLDFINKKQYDSALTPLHAAAIVSQNSARFHGDLAFALAEAGNLEEAGNEYATAVRLQSANPWYCIGLATVRANQQRWSEASANFELAYAADSTVLTPGIVAAASQAAEKASDETEVMQWAQRGTARFPDDPTPWLRMAILLRGRDSAKGLDAIRHFRRLQPGDRMGAAFYALYLYPLGAFDSAYVMARQAAPDSNLKQYASHVFLQAGAHWLNAKQYDSSAAALGDAVQILPNGDTKTRATYWLALADAMRIGTMFNAAVAAKDCDKAVLMDSLLTSVSVNLAAGAQIDSAQAARLQTGFVPTMKQRLTDFKNGCH